MAAESNAGPDSTAATRPAAALINRILAGRYEILEMIGEGPLLSAFRARDRSQNRVVAIKILVPGRNVASQSSVVQKLREGLGEILALSHANLTRAFDVGADEENGIPVFVAEEYVRGIDLKERIRRTAPFQLTAATDAAIAIAEALEFAHARGIAHGDVRPQNVIIGPEGQVKLSNFGVAEAQNAAMDQNPNLLQRVVSYVAPDAAASARPTASADLYALGVILYEMLTGDLPYKGDNPVQIALKHAQEAVPSPRNINLGVPRALEGIVLRALGKRPEDRYASAAEMLSDLREVREALRYGKPLAWSPLDRGRAAAPAMPASGTPMVPGAGTASAGAMNAAAAASPAYTPVHEQELAEDEEEPDGTIVMPGRSIRGAGALEARRGGTVTAAATAAPSRSRTAAPKSRQREEVEEDDDDYPRGRRGRGGGNGGRWLTFINLFLFLVVLGALGYLVYSTINIFQPQSEVVVPNLVGRTMTDAKTLSHSQKFELTIVDEQYQDKIAADTIYQQRPAPGYHIREGKQVSIWVSKGPHMAQVPDIQQIALDRAKRIVESNGLKIGQVKYEYDTMVAKGNVLSQTPQPGETKPRGSAVDVVLSKGEEPTPTPEPMTSDDMSPPIESSPTETPTPTATDDVNQNERQRTFAVGYKVPSDGQPHHVRIDVEDRNGQRTSYDETHQPGETISKDVEGIGSQITIKLYDNDVLRSRQTK